MFCSEDEGNLLVQTSTKSLRLVSVSDGGQSRTKEVIYYQQARYNTSMLYSKICTIKMKRTSVDEGESRSMGISLKA